jgi:hypothetical protein
MLCGHTVHLSLLSTDSLDGSHHLQHFPNFRGESFVSILDENRYKCDPLEAALA